MLKKSLRKIMILPHHIQLTSDNIFRVQFQYKTQRYSQRFRTLEKAVEWRDAHLIEKSPATPRGARHEYFRQYRLQRKMQGTNSAPISIGGPTIVYWD